MKAIHQFVAGFTAGDAISNEALAPGSLFTPISQPMALANCAQIERPKPAPPCFLVTGPSACVNGWNNRSRYSDDMPIPWSVTSIRRTTSSSGLPDS